MAPEVANKIYHDIGKRQKTGISPKKTDTRAHLKTWSVENLIIEFA